MDDLKNAKIKEACNLIKGFHFLLAGSTFFETRDESVMETTAGVVKDTINGSPIDVLIEKNNWEELFNNQRWLTFLRGAQNMSVLEKGLNAPLKTLSEFFPKETENHIIPDFLR